jgi:guanylate kinase
MSKRGRLVVVSGFSGAGKGTLMRRLVKKYHQYALSISATTRKPRPGEIHGREYFFYNVEQFEKLIKTDALFEYAKYVDNYYGTPKDYVEQKLAQGKNVILEIEVQGALKVKEQEPDVLLIFVTPPSIKELKRRLHARGTEEKAIIASRLARAVKEVQAMQAYDYLLVNDDLESCVDRMHMVISSSHCEVARCEELIRGLEGELEQYG